MQRLRTAISDYADVSKEQWGSGLSGRFFAFVLLIMLGVVVSTPAKALTTVFTDRAAFNAAIGAHTVLTFDTPKPFTIRGQFFEVTHGDILHIAGDESGVAEIYQIPGALHDNGYPGFGMPLLRPVDAVGFDIVPHAPGWCFPQECDSTPFVVMEIGGERITILEPTFLGFHFSEPTPVGLRGRLFMEGINPAGWTEPRMCGPGECTIGNSSFVLDNLAIKVASVPEPSSSLFVATALAGLGMWTYVWRRRAVRQRQSF